jgi:hypothetical protein
MLPVRERAAALRLLQQRLSQQQGFSVGGQDLVFAGAARLGVTLAEHSANAAGLESEHLHVVATVAQSPLDFCLLGLGHSATEAMDEAVEVFANRGLGVALAAGAIRSTGTTPFVGTEPWPSPPDAAFWGRCSCAVSKSHRRSNRKSLNFFPRFPPFRSMDGPTCSSGAVADRRRLRSELLNWMRKPWSATSPLSSPTSTVLRW